MVFSGRADGDFAIGAGGSTKRARLVVDRQWATLRQVHGAAVVVVDDVAVVGFETEPVADGDALVTTSREVALAVRVADCAPLALASGEGVVGIVHAGWRGLVAGVVEVAADAMRAVGATTIRGALGPCIHPECYEFAEADLDVAADRLGPTVRGTTARGQAALDIPAAVCAAASRAQVDVVAADAACTSCDRERYWSHRGRAETARQVGVVWRP